jgi:aconitate hydratase
MVNGLAVLGWGVGGIEAEAAMLGQPISMLIPEVVGFELTGALPEGTTATDLVLTVVEMLRAKGVVGKFVEFYGSGLDHLPLADRATIANMAPEYGATCGFFPIGKETIRYLELSGRDAAQIRLVEAYAKAQGLWREAGAPAPDFTDTLSLDMSEVEPSISGPKRPQDRIALGAAAQAFAEVLPEIEAGAEVGAKIQVAGEDYAIGHGDVVIAAITSCTNTSNPSVLMAAGLLAKKAVEKGLAAKPWVKTSLAPGSQVVADYLDKAGLQPFLNQLGFNVVAFGCTSCIGNSGPLAEAVAETVETGDLVATAVLSGNRNFEGRINPLVRANYLASPPLVVAYAIAGSLNLDLTTEPLGTGSDGEPVYLRDIWPSLKEVADAVSGSLSAEMFQRRYADIFEGSAEWRGIEAKESLTYDWNAVSTYVKHPPFFEEMSGEPGQLADIEGARLLALLGDSVTTDHISPAGSITEEGPAGEYLVSHQVPAREFNSYGARRGNHEVMMRGTFANIRIRNELAAGTEGGVTRHQPSGELMSMYAAAMRYQADGVPLVVVAGKEYGTGSSRDWAAKGTRLLGIKAAIVESFERIHRSNLVGMGVLPLQFKAGTDRKSLGLTGAEIFDLGGVADGIEPGQDVACRITYADGRREEITLTCRIDTLDEVEYYRHGGILQYVLRNLMAAA